MQRKCRSKAEIVDSERCILHFSEFVFRPVEWVAIATAESIAAGPQGTFSAQSEVFTPLSRVFTRLRRGPLTA